MLGLVPTALECDKLRGRVRAEMGVVVPGRVLPSHAGRSPRAVSDPFPFPFAAAAAAASRDLVTVACPSSELFGLLDAGVAFAVRRLAPVAGRKCA